MVEPEGHTDITRDKKFRSDVAVNMVTFGILGVSGIVLNMVIGRFWGAEAMGVFRQILAAYLFVSQVSVWGIQFSTTKHVAEFVSDRGEVRRVVTAALLLVALTSGGVVFLCWLGADLFAFAMDSPGVGVGWLWALPGLFFFPVNKVMLAVLNGMRAMKPFGVFQSARYVLMLIFVGLCVLAEVDGEKLAVVLSASEIVLFLLLGGYVARVCPLVVSSGVGSWVKKHFSYGGRGVVSGSLADINSSVDILLLGVFVDDALVGIYGLASLVLEGVAELAIIFRNHVNPLLTHLSAKRDLEGIQDLVQTSKGKFLWSMAFVGAAALAVYPFFISICIGDQVFMQGWVVLAVLMVGHVLRSGYLPFSMLLIQAGFPGTHSVMLMLIVASNVVLNALLIPWLGMMGAAIATSLSYVLSVPCLKYFSARCVGVRI